MPPTITIPDDFYREAAAAIAQIRSVNETNVKAGDIEKVLRSYVWLGVNKRILDWAYNLTDDQRDAIVRAVQGRTQYVYSLFPDYSRTYTNLETMETLAANGQVSPNIARPRSYQEQYEAQLTEAHAGDRSPIVAGIQNFFAAVKSGADAALAGLGIKIPVEVIIALVLLVLFLPYLRRPA